MIIGHEHRYVFMELPHTGSTAVARELREHYGGEKILGKHSSYDQFRRVASEDELSYFTFSAVRNPLDVAVTKYVKYANNHNERYTDPVKVARNRGLGHWAERRIQQRIVEDHQDFSEFFLSVYRFPFNTWASLDHADFGYVMRFENLQDEFAKALELIGVEPVRPLPVVNSSSRESDFSSYYNPEAIERAKKVFAGYMDEWGYEFPESWGPASYTTTDQAKYRMATAAMKFYWLRLKSKLWIKDMTQTVATTSPQ